MFTEINAAWYMLLQEGLIWLGATVITVHITLAVYLLIFGGMRVERSRPWGARGAFTQARFEDLESR